MGSIHEVVEALRQEPSNSERGTAFEKLMVRYFELDPMLASKYDQVSRWIDWPGRNGKVDTGIDLVARERDTGDWTAIQCKFYEPTTTLAKEHIDSFFTASGKTPFTNRIIVSTTDKWSKNAEDALDGQTIPVQRIDLATIADSPIDWDIAWPSDGLHIELSEATRHEPRKHQQQAIDKVFAGFGVGHARGKLIMACGTGKTFTALKIAERLAAENGGSARILFAVPSISLLSQTLREWSAQTQLDLRAFAVCSDTKVSRAAEDIAVHDVAIPVTTSASTLAQEMSHRKRAKGLTVVFTTYQSLPQVAAAQDQGIDPFDLAICDEAHRTTGVTVANGDESHFVRVHDATFLRATRRLYMTATPRIFADTVKAKAEEVSAEIASMDDETKYGPEFHRLSFGEAVERGLLTDYKVLVLTVDEELVAAPLQKQFAGGEGELRLDDASKIVGCWNGLAKRAGRSPDGTGFAPGEVPMRRAVAFAENIATSKQVAALFPRVVDAYRTELTDSENDGAHVDTTNVDLACAVHHVDGTFNALERNRELQWLKAPLPEGECRILTNARCLSEGVDVPALDAVLFLHPRNSVVDVVQSVGRVMRKAEGKDYGYIILPVAVPAGVSPSKALADNKRFKVVWQVLNALRAHDDRFNAMVNAIALNTTEPGAEKGQGSDKLLGGHIGATGTEPETPAASEPAAPGAPDEPTSSGTEVTPTQMALFALSEWQEAIFARIVDKVGTRTYWEDWARDVADIAGALITRITALLDGADPATAAAFGQFHQGLRDNLNDNVSRVDAVSMLAQHLITRPVFDALFADSGFAEHNPVSRAMEMMLSRLGDAGLGAETAHLEGFYDSVRVRASEVSTASGKQQVIAELYEKFFKIGFAKQADQLGIVYTPVEIVDFILRAADQASRDAFGRGLTDEGVTVLDPFTGTGTFITRLMQSGLIKPEDLARKYASELYANDIMLLAYYVAAVNIETTYHALTGAEYQPFQGIVLADTFQITEADDSFDAMVFPQNNDRINRELATPIDVIVGNPPYSVGQSAANDLNANVAYPTLDGRITETYAKRSTAQLKNSLYDSYLRAFRWATDRVSDRGVVAFVSNGGWIDGNTADGIRLSLEDEYARLYIYNLRGNQRTAGDLSRKEGGKVFGGGSRNTVAILVGVRDPQHKGPCAINYRDIGDYLTREDKLDLLTDATLETVEWRPISPNVYGDWVSQRSDLFATWPSIGGKGEGERVFGSNSRGLATSRDAWCYNSSRKALESNIATTIAHYNSEVERVASLRMPGTPLPPIGQLLEPDSKQFSWDRVNKRQVVQGTRIDYRPDGFRIGTYRPFFPQHAYFDERQQLNNCTYQLPLMFPTEAHANVGIVLTGPASHFEFTPFMTDLLPNLHLLDTAQFFPRWRYEKAGDTDGGLDLEIGSEKVDKYGYRRIDNITDAIVERYQEALRSSVSKDDIFYSVYGQLHDPTYRENYAADLRKMLPRIPTPSSRARFDQLAAAGRALADLHIRYDAAQPHPGVTVQVKPGVDPLGRETWRVQKMKWKTKGDHTAIVYNQQVTVIGIPEEAERYQLGSRSALGWVLDRWQRKVDKPSGIVNDPNDWCDEHDDPKYIVNLIARVATVAVESMAIVDQLATEPIGNETSRE